MTSHDSPFPVQAFEQLAVAEAGHWWFRARNRILLWVLKTRVGPFRSLLEIGCGTGFVLEGIRQAYPDADLYGSEYFEEGLVVARARIPSATFTQLDATAMCETGRYDVIGAFDVLEHIEQDEKVLGNLARALTPGGRLLISVPQHRWLWSGVDDYSCHQRRYSRAELAGKVERAGLQPTYVTSFVSFLAPLMWLARRRGKVTAAEAMREFEIPRWLNRSLEAVMNLEIWLLQHGCRFPLGGSLLLVARRD